ncbi:MAG: hypothetical protein Q9227_003269 [Pyrenula ochraceoflavens]
MPFLTSAGSKEDDDGVLTGYELLYKFPSLLVNVVILYDRSSETNSSKSAESKLMEKLDDAGLWSDDDSESEERAVRRTEDVEAEIQEFVDEVCQPTFNELSKTQDRITNDESHPFYLHQHLHPKTVHLQIITRDGKAEVIPCAGVQPQSRFLRSKDVSLLGQKMLPVYEPSKIEVVELLGQWILRVSVGGQDLCCKLNIDDGIIMKEYRALQRVTEHGPSSMRVPKLRGLVVEDDGVVGLLLDYIPTRYTTLTAAVESAAEEDHAARKAKWAAQVEETLALLHAIDVVWGDVKPENILIDEKDDAWLLDFGGGWTEGWVDRRLANTKEGDLQGVKRLRQMLTEAGWIY